ncbi:hypothetical protein BC828DRAFT_372071 [Blastocladiella britannica]|nr:hypothetical protein BC828DRAFT_372071 [Blastocladiella britannica]
MNLLDLPDDVLEDIARFLDLHAIAAFRAASHATATSRLVLANRTLAAYFALCRNDADQFYVIMPRYLGKHRARHTRFTRPKAQALFAAVATCLVRGNIGPGRPWALLNAWAHGRNLMTPPIMTELAQWALSRGASHALLALLKYRHLDPIGLAAGGSGRSGRSDNSHWLRAYFAHPRMSTDPQRIELALQLTVPLVRGAHFSWSFAASVSRRELVLALAHIAALDATDASSWTAFSIFDEGARSHRPTFCMFEAMMDAYYLSRHDPSILTSSSSSSSTESLELVRARLVAHAGGDNQLAQRLAEWMVHFPTEDMHRILLEALSYNNRKYGSLSPFLCPDFVDWAARYLPRENAQLSSLVHHAVARGVCKQLHIVNCTRLVIAYLRGFPLDLTHTIENDCTEGGCHTCGTAGGAPRNDEQLQCIMRALPASDLEIALARRTSNVKMHAVLATDPNAIQGHWYRMLSNKPLDVGALFRAWGDLDRSETQLLRDAGVPPLSEPMCGLGGAGIHLSTLMAAFLFRTFDALKWRAGFVDALAAARETWPEVVASWRADAMTAMHVGVMVLALRRPAVECVSDMLSALAEAGIQVEVMPEDILSLSKS